MKEKAKDTNLYDFEKDMGKIEEKLAEWTGLEPATLGVTGRYSNQLNYHSTKGLIIHCLMTDHQGRHESLHAFEKAWRSGRDSNPRPSA